MSLFRRKNKTSPAAPAAAVRFAQPQRSLLFRKEFIQAGSFRGFRRVKLQYVDVEGCSETLDAFRAGGFSFKGLPIRIEGIGVQSNGESYRIVDVYVDGCLIGRVKSTDDAGLSMLCDSEYDQAYLKVDEAYHADGSVMGANVYLFVHLI